MVMPNECQLAYIMATAHGEVGEALLPVREGNRHQMMCSARRIVANYCKKKGITNYAADVNGRSYYGRGFVQITHRDNYDKMGRHLGIGSGGATPIVRSKREWPCGSCLRA